MIYDFRHNDICHNLDNLKKNKSNIVHHYIVHCIICHYVILSKKKLIIGWNDLLGGFQNV